MVIEDKLRKLAGASTNRANSRQAPRCCASLWPFSLRSRGLLSALASSTLTRTEKSQEMKAMRLTRNEHHRKLRAPIRDVSDWLVNADVSDFCRPPWRCTRPPEDSSTFRTSTITCCLPRLPATFPRLPATFPRLPAAPND